MSTEEFVLTPTAFRALLPGKIAQTVHRIAQKQGLSPLDAFRAFYRSDTYRLLEDEETKCWWESPAQLLEDFELEKAK